MPPFLSSPPPTLLSSCSPHTLPSPPPQEDILAEAEAHGGRLLVTREAEADGGNTNGGGSAALARQVVEAFEPVAGPEAVQTPKQVHACCGAAAAASAAAFAALRVRRVQPHPLSSGSFVCLLTCFLRCCDCRGPTQRRTQSAAHCQTRIKVSFLLSPAPTRQVYEALQAEGYRVTFVRIPLTDGACPLPRDFDAFYSAAAAAGPSDALIYTCQVGARCGPGL